MTKVRSNRVNAWFIGVMNGEEVNFKFTYSYDINKQVKIKTKVGMIATTLDFFNNNVKPLTIGINKFVEVR